MVRVEINATIERPIDEVFEQLVDIPSYARWMPGDGLFVTCTKDSPGPAGAGTTYTEKTRLGTVHGEIAEFERPGKVVFHYAARLLGVKVMEGWPGYTLERDGDAATRLHHTAVGRLSGPFRLMQPLVQRIARKERQRTVDALKQSLEARRGGPRRRERRQSPGTG